ncbi:MAG: FAD:protein FMN transferase [Ilumatobacteraceae bacterium]
MTNVDATNALQRTLKVMGCTAHLVVHGGNEAMLDEGERRLRELESWWSRFLATSDITRANEQPGVPVEVQPDTLAVVARAVDGWKQTDGRFDITVLPALVHEGYSRSVVTRDLAPVVPATRIGTSGWIVVDYGASTLTVPPGSAIDLGGIGKGFAADVVAEDLLEMGASGVVVNVGGDLRVGGSPSADASWHLGIENPLDPPHHIAFLRVGQGGIATSGTTIRRWKRSDGTTAHHLIDPTTGRTSTTHVLTATVIASDAATAEVFATSVMLMDPRAGVAMLERVGLAGLIVTTDGAVHRTSTLGAFEL